MSLKYLAATFLLALSAASAEPPLPALRIEPTTGGSIFYVKNVASKPLVGYVVELVDYPGSFFQLWRDEVTATPISPGQEVKIPVANMTVGAVPDYVKIQAAVYADGSTAGSAEKIGQLTNRRRFSLDTVRDMIQKLESAKESKTPKEAALAVLRRSQQFMVLPPSADKSSQLAINQTAARTLYSDAAEYLDKHTTDETLAKLHEWEKALENSKPAL